MREYIRKSYLKVRKSEAYVFRMGTYAFCVLIDHENND
jgi:hypothetical protein